jgi:hypothetical protein
MAAVWRCELLQTQLYESLTHWYLTINVLRYAVQH